MKLLLFNVIVTTILISDVFGNIVANGAGRAAQTGLRAARTAATHIKPTNVPRIGIKPPKVGGTGGGVGISTGTKAGGRLANAFGPGLFKPPLNGGATFRQFGTKLTGFANEAKTKLMAQGKQVQKTVKLIESLKTQTIDPALKKTINSATNLSVQQKKSMISVARFMVCKGFTETLTLAIYVAEGVVLAQFLHLLIRGEDSDRISPFQKVQNMALMLFPSLEDEFRDFDSLVDEWVVPMRAYGIEFSDEQIENFKLSWNITKEYVQEAKENIIGLKESFPDMLDALMDYNVVLNWLAEKGADIAPFYIPFTGMRPDYDGEKLWDPVTETSSELITDLENDDVLSLGERVAKLGRDGFVRGATATVNVPKHLQDIADQIQAQYALGNEDKYVAMSAGHGISDGDEIYSIPNNVDRKYWDPISEVTTDHIEDLKNDDIKTVPERVGKLAKDVVMLPTTLLNAPKHFNGIAAQLKPKFSGVNGVPRFASSAGTGRSISAEIQSDASLEGVD